MNKKPLEEIADSFIKDYLDGMSTIDIEKKYGWSWASMRKIFKARGNTFRRRGGHRPNAGRKFGVKNRWGG